MEKITLKQLLASMAALTIVAPTTIGILASIDTNVANPELEQQIVNAINNEEIAYELSDIAIKTTVPEVASLITGYFVKTKLSPELKDNFDAGLFKLNKITENGHDLVDSRLEQAQTIYAKFNYNYGSITNQEAIILIHVTGIDDEQIAFAISQAVYQTQVAINSPAEDIKESISDEFIQAQLADDIKSAFNKQSFKFNNIIVNGSSILSDNDLKKSGTIYAQINFNYGQFENYQAIFKIIVK